MFKIHPYHTSNSVITRKNPAMRKEAIFLLLNHSSYENINKVKSPEKV